MDCAERETGGDILTFVNGAGEKLVYFSEN